MRGKEAIAEELNTASESIYGRCVLEGVVHSTAFPSLCNYYESCAIEWYASLCTVSQFSTPLTILKRASHPDDFQHQGQPRLADPTTSNLQLQRFDPVGSDPPRATQRDSALRVQYILDAKLLDGFSEYIELSDFGHQTGAPNGNPAIATKTAPRSSLLLSGQDALDTTSRLLIKTRRRCRRWHPGTSPRSVLGQQKWNCLPL